jgi:general secretion pathway protein D
MYSCNFTCQYRKIAAGQRSFSKSNKIPSMRALAPLIIFSLLAAAFGETNSRKIELRNLRKAQKESAEAIEFIRGGDFSKAQELLDDALNLDPHNLTALTGRELLRQNQIQQKVSEANLELESNRRDKAISAFQQALTLDPDDPFAKAGLHAALAQAIADKQHSQLRYRDADEIHVEPNDTKHDFHYKGDSRGLLTQIWNAYGVRPLIDNSVTSKQVRFDLEGADFASASIIAGEMTKTFYVPLSKDQSLIVADTSENRKNFERLALRTFYIGDASSAQDINDAVTMLRTIFDFHFISPAAGSNQVTVRAPMSILGPATRILEDLYSGKPQVMLDVNIFQVEQTLARDLGIGIPTQFTLFNVDTEAANLLNNPSNQNLINQLISSGAINQANSSTIAALLAGLAAGGGNSILNQPIATFGGGLTKSGVIIPGTTFHASLNESSFQSLDHLMLRTAQGDAATFRDGMRFPILNTIFSPISTSPAIASVLQNQSFTAPFPSFSYEDLGLTLKATPTIHGNHDVSLKLEFQIRGLGATQLNGVPVITNREYAGTIGVPLGETAVLTGMVTKSEQLSLQGLPGISKLPILGKGTSVTNKQTDDAELLITLRPYLVRESVHNPNAGTAFVPPPSTQ